jgi:hypothetical protein
MTEDPIRQSEEEREKKEEDRDGILGRLYRWYKRYDKWSGRGIGSIGCLAFSKPIPLPA